MYVCMYVCICVYMYAYMYACVCVCIFVQSRVCVCVYIYECIVRISPDGCFPKEEFVPWYWEKYTSAFKLNSLSSHAPSPSLRSSFHEEVEVERFCSSGRTPPPLTLQSLGLHLSRRVHIADVFGFPVESARQHHQLLHRKPFSAHRISLDPVHNAVLRVSLTPEDGLSRRMATHDGEEGAGSPWQFGVFPSIFVVDPHGQVVVASDLHSAVVTDRLDLLTKIPAVLPGERPYELVISFQEIDIARLPGMDSTTSGGVHCVEVSVENSPFSCFFRHTIIAFPPGRSLFLCLSCSILWLPPWLSLSCHITATWVALLSGVRVSFLCTRKMEKCEAWCTHLFYLSTVSVFDLPEQANLHLEMVYEDILMQEEYEDDSPCATHAVASGFKVLSPVFPRSAGQ